MLSGLTLAKYGIVVAAVAGAIWWLTDRYDSGFDAGTKSGYDSGHAEGHNSGFEAGRKSAEASAKEREETLRAEIRSAELQEREVVIAKYREIEDQMRAQIFASQLKASAAVASLEADIAALDDELRDARARRADRNPNSCRRLPQAAGGGIAPAIPDWGLSQESERSIVGLAGDAERLNIQYGKCVEALNTLKSQLAAKPSGQISPNDASKKK